MDGTMIWFNRVKRHGFIRTDDGERLRVDESGLVPGAVLAERCAGAKVRFERVPGAGDDARAVGVMLVPPTDARRARTRGWR